jgi:DNA-binding LacI/PurR family transcriptional regulator
MTLKRQATMRDVAELAGVSISSVSNYTNGRWQRLSEERRETIAEAIASLGYRVNSPARSLRSSRTRTLGLLALDDTSRFLADPLTGLYLAGLGDSAREKGYSVLVHASGSRRKRDEMLLPIAESRVDAACVLLSGTRSLRMRILEGLGKSGIPLAVLDETDTLDAAPKAHSVRADQESGASTLVDYLVSQGHTRIAFIAAKTPWAVLEQRYEGFKKTARAHSIRVNPDWVLFEGDWTPDSARPMVDKLLSLKSKPTAIVCGSDLLAIGAIRKVTERGLRVPDDVAVAGFDDFDVSRNVSPSLTTVRVPAWEMGYAAADVLISDLAQTQYGRSSLVLETELIPRESA